VRPKGGPSKTRKENQNRRWLDAGANNKFTEDISMSFSIATNLNSLNAQNALSSTQMSLSTTLQRLSSGLRINSAADDAAGLAIANRDLLDNSGVTAGIQAANDAISNLQIKDGAMNNITSLLNRALTLASQAASTTFTGSRSTLDNEFQSVLSEITRDAGAAGLQTASSDLNVRSVFVGNTQINTGASVSYVSWTLTTAVDSQGLGISTQNITSQANAVAAISALQTAVGTLGTVQGAGGAAMNRLTFAIDEAQTLSTSIQAARSRIMDANMAQEATNLTKFNILTQSGMAALAQANQSSSAVLSLLR
jgi:flagellin